jgi:hypothetical protein
MKKILYSLAALVLLGSSAYAGVVVPGTAKTVAANFYSQTTQKQVSNITLVYTEVSATGEPVYFAYNVNGTEGFVLVSAEDAGRPILGYSTEGNYIVPSATSNPELNFFMQARKSEIEAIRIQNGQADVAISKEWSDYVNNKIHNPVALSTPHAPLVKSTWNQSGGGAVPFNNLCPGGSVTGCVATTMAQIMRYWEYPTQGTGSHSYNAGTYGTLTANFATTYNWANMPLAGSNADVAKISYHCGVSVNMNYSPSGSGAQVCGSGGPSAQYSYKTYYKYDPGLHCMSYSGNTATWNAALVAEFAAGRPVQYVGVDPTAGGHTWVCDGNDAADKMHQNWGWGGASDGYYDVTALTPSGMNFSNQMDALIGIKPLTPTTALDLGAYTITSPAGTSCNGTFTPVISIRNFGATTVTSCTINYNVDGGTNQTFSWSGSLPSFQSTSITLPAMTVAVGAHIFNVSSSMPNGSADGNTANDQMSSMVNVLSSTASKQLSYTEGFETAGFPYSDCYLYSKTGPLWSTTATAAKTGTTSLEVAMFGAGSGDGDEFITPSIDMTNVTTATMTFQVAHAQLNATDADQLQVLASTNCGGAWVQKYSKFGSALATGGVMATAFTPTASQWRMETVNISSAAGMPDVRFKFKFNSNGAGNNVFIDDININTSGNGVPEEFVNGFDLNVYPNPMVDQTTISFTIHDKYNVAIGIYDIIGKEIVPVSNATELNAGSYSLPLSKNFLNKGVYFVKLEVNGYSVTKKIVVQ